MQLHQPNARGTVMMEMVLVLPFVLVVLMLIVYFGRGVVRVQHTRVMDRYAAWQHVAASPGPSADSGSDNQQLNDTFFGGNADSVTYELEHNFPADAEDALIDLAFSYSNSAGQLATAHLAHINNGPTVRLTTQHAQSNRVWQKFDRPIVHSHTRFGNDQAHINGWSANAVGQWSRSGSRAANILIPVRDVFLWRHDRELTALTAETPLAATIRNLYLAQPGYAGPQVHDEDFLRD